MEVTPASPPRSPSLGVCLESRLGKWRTGGNVEGLDFTPKGHGSLSPIWEDTKTQRSQATRQRPHSMSARKGVEGRVLPLLPGAAAFLRECSSGAQCSNR